jgi:hypothetical protein
VLLAVVHVDTPLFRYCSVVVVPALVEPFTQPIVAVVAVTALAVRPVGGGGGVTTDKVMSPP